LPSPQELRTRPELVTRRALNQLKSADDLDLALRTRTLSVSDLNDSCSNGSTPLVNAIFRNDPALMEALLARGADLNRSTPDYYPLTLAIFLKQPDPVRILLEHHADVNGAPDPLETPLMAACSVADQALAQRLLDAGANPLDSRASGPMGMRQSTASFASPEQKSYHDWFQQVVNEALRKTGQYEWSAWIDQSGKRTRITQDCTIALRKMPFKLITRMKEETPFLVIASEDMDLLKQMDDARFHRMALSGAFTGASDADSKYLGIASLAMAEGYFTHFSNNDWGYYAEPRMRRGTVRVAGKGPVEYVHSVEELDTPDGHHWGKDFPGAALAMVMGVLPPIGSGTELYRPLKFTLKF
jgi:hypothetical protein